MYDHDHDHDYDSELKGIGFVILMLALVSGSAASASELFGVAGDGASDDPESLYSVSTVNASTIFIQTLGNGTDGESIAFNANDGLMYHWSGFTVGGGHIMETIDLDVLGVIDLPTDFSSYDPSEVRGSTFDPITGNFIFTDYNGNLSSATPGGVFSKIGLTDRFLRGLTFNGGRLYGGEHSGSGLYDLDPNTGVTISTVPVTLNGINVSGILALTTDPDTGVLYTIIKISRSSRHLATLDPVTGGATDIGPLPHGFANIEFRITIL